MCHEYSRQNRVISDASVLAIYETWSEVSTPVEFRPL